MWDNLIKGSWLLIGLLFFTTEIILFGAFLSRFANITHETTPAGRKRSLSNIPVALSLFCIILGLILITLIANAIIRTQIMKMHQLQVYPSSY